MLKEHTARGVQLTFPDYSQDASPMDLYTDASGAGASACLAQKQSFEVSCL